MTNLLPLVSVAATLLNAPVNPGQVPPDDVVPEAQKALPKNTVSTNPLTPLFLGTYVLEYERALNEHWALHVSPFFQNATLPTLTPGTPGKVSLRGFGGTVGVRYFPFKASPTGFFVGPELQGSHVNVSGDSGTGPWVSFAARAMLGYTFLIGGIIDVSLGLGGGAQYNIVSLTGGTVPLNTGFLSAVAGIQPTAALRLNLGIAF